MLTFLAMVQNKTKKSKFCCHIIHDKKKNISRCNDNLSLCRDHFPLFRYFLLFCLILKSFGLKGTHSTELFYGVGMGEHTALVPSVRGNTKRCDTGVTSERGEACFRSSPIY